MKRRLLPLALSLCLLCSLLPAAGAEENEDAPSPVTALCIAEPGQSVFLDEKEFQLLCRQATGHDLESVTFSPLSAGVGKLACRGEQVKTEDAYYRYQRPAISDVCFTPYAYSSVARFTGQAELAFTMTSEEEETVSGTLIFCVPEEPSAPVEDPVENRTVKVKPGKAIDLCNYLSDRVRHKVKSSYTSVDVTSVTFALPSSAQGSLWLDYGFENARKLLPEEVLFPDREPNFHNLTFVPANAEEGGVQLSYTISTEKKGGLPAFLTLNFAESYELVRPAVSSTTDVSSQPPRPHHHFQDMAEWGWAASAAEFLEDKGYRRGESWFYPGEQATRMDLIYALVLTAYSDSRRDTPVPAFSDLPADETLAKAAAVAAERGLVLGNGAGLLLPDDPITRQDALVILHRAMVDHRKLLPLYGDLSAFSDAGDVAPYAQEAATILAARGILLGDGSGRLDPLSPITRAEMACLLHRAFE